MVDPAIAIVERILPAGRKHRIERLAKMVGVSYRSAQRLIGACESAGELNVERGSGRGNTSLYFINLPTSQKAVKIDPKGVYGDADHDLTFPDADIQSEI